MIQKHQFQILKKCHHDLINENVHSSKKFFYLNSIQVTHM